MLLSSVFKTFLLREIDASNHTKIKGRPIILQDEEALNCIFKVLRTGMQWREIQSSVSYATVFRRFQQWTNKDIFRKAYKKALLTYKRLVPTKYYCIDSSYIKNRFGQRCVGKNHTDRGRKAIKLSIVTDQNGVTYSASTLPGNQPDVTSLSSSLIHMLSSLDSVPLYADRGYDSRHNRTVSTTLGLQDRIFRRRTKTCRRTNAKRIVVENAFSWLDKYTEGCFFFTNKALNRFCPLFL
jgi:hypothetical protein